MKKNLLIVATLISTQTYAGRIIPNFEWNETQRNYEGSALIGKERNIFGYNYFNFDSDNNKNNNSDFKRSRNRLFAFGVEDKYQYEANVEIHNIEDGSDESSETYIDFLAAKDYGDISFGGYINYTINNDEHSHFLSGSFTKKLNKFYLGGGLRANYWDRIQNYYQEYYIGLGYRSAKDKYTGEFFVKVRPEQNTDKDGTLYEVDPRTVFVFDGQAQFKNFQIVPYVSYTTINDETGVDRSEKKTTYVSTKFDYKVLPNKFIGLIVSNTNVEYTDNDTASSSYESDTLNYGLSARALYKKYQLEVIAMHGKDERTYQSSYSDEEDEQSLSLTASIFF